MAGTSKPTEAPSVPPQDVAPAESPFPRPQLDITEKGLDPPAKETRGG